MRTELNRNVEELREDTAGGVTHEGEVSLGGAASLMSTIEDIAKSFDVSGFKCTECGLAHQHDTNKHRASDSFDMSEDDVASMEYNGNCHCGVQELGRRGGDFGVSEDNASSTARSAPISDEATREMNSRFGRLA